VKLGQLGRSAHFSRAFMSAFGCDTGNMFGRAGVRFFRDGRRHGRTSARREASAVTLTDVSRLQGCKLMLLKLRQDTSNNRPRRFRSGRFTTPA